MKRFNRKFKMFTRTTIITDDVVNVLKTILEKNPEYYLDEIAEELVKETGIYLPFSTIYKTIKDKLNYSLQVCYKSAKQRDELERRRYKAVLKSLVKTAEQVLVIDEAHTDKRASRRRRAWGKRNSGGIGLKNDFITKLDTLKLLDLILSKDLQKGVLVYIQGKRYLMKGQTVLWILKLFKNG